MDNRGIIKHSFILSLPVFFAYFPLGIVFGVLFTHSGFSWYFAPIMSAVVYGGSVQFVALSMMTNTASVWAIIAATVFIAFRNSFYGLNLLDRFKTNWLIKSLLIFMLVDATYALLVLNPPKDGENDLRFCFWVSLFLYVYWVAGTLVGSIFAQWIPPFKALSFILPAFFMVLAVDYFIAKRRWDIILMPIVCSVVAYLLFPKEYFLLAIIFSIGSIFVIAKVGRKADG